MGLTEKELRGLSEIGSTRKPIRSANKELIDRDSLFDETVVGLL